MRIKSWLKPYLYMFSDVLEAIYVIVFPYLERCFRFVRHNQETVIKLQVFTFHITGSKT